MKNKRVFVIIISLLAVFTLVACKTKKDSPVTQQQTTAFNDTVYESVAETVVNTENTDSNNTGYYVQETSQISSVERTNGSEQAQTLTSADNDDPANWSTERIVEEYKKAARKSNSTVKSTQSISLKDISVNDGEHDNVMSFIGGIIGKFLESNSTEKAGVTGGFENLVPQDINSAKAYKQGNDTIIEMLMVEQTSGANEDALSGSVGHAITAVGDIGVVVKDLEERGLPLELSEEDTKIYYTNPVVKVVINDSGEIISGTWSYTVEICMNNFKAFGQDVEKASIIMDNVITV